MKLRFSTLVSVMLLSGFGVLHAQDGAKDLKKRLEALSDEWFKTERQWNWENYPAVVNAWKAIQPRIDALASAKISSPRRW